MVSKIEGYTRVTTLLRREVIRTSKTEYTDSEGEGEGEGESNDKLA